VQLAFIQQCGDQQKAFVDRNENESAHHKDHATVTTDAPYKDSSMAVIGVRTLLIRRTLPNEENTTFRVHLYQLGSQRNLRVSFFAVSLQ